MSNPIDKKRRTREEIYKKKFFYRQHCIRFLIIRSQVPTFIELVVRHLQ